MRRFTITSLILAATATIALAVGVLSSTAEAEAEPEAVSAPVSIVVDPYNVVIAPYNPETGQVGEINTGALRTKLQDGTPIVGFAIHKTAGRYFLQRRYIGSQAVLAQNVPLVVKGQALKLDSAITEEIIDCGWCDNGSQCSLCAPKFHQGTGYCSCSLAGASTCEDQEWHIEWDPTDIVKVQPY